MNLSHLLSGSLSTARLPTAMPTNLFFLHAIDPGEKQHIDEEPEVGSKSDIPIDGRDEEGEAMIRDLPKPTEKPGESR